jgi:hypothetical protein
LTAGHAVVTEKISHLSHSTKSYSFYSLLFNFGLVFLVLLSCVFLVFVLEDYRQSGLKSDQAHQHFPACDVKDSRQFVWC